MAQYSFERESRTPHSESYVITSDGTDVGRVDIHYTGGLVYATLCVPEEFSEEEVQQLIGDVDERLVMTAEPYREDFVVTVWAGRQAGVYSEEEMEEEEEEEPENGHHF